MENSDSAKVFHVITAGFFLESHWEKLWACCKNEESWIQKPFLKSQSWHFYFWTFLQTDKRKPHKSWCGASRSWASVFGGSVNAEPRRMLLCISDVLSEIFLDGESIVMSVCNVDSEVSPSLRMLLWSSLTTALWKKLFRLPGMLL